MSKLILKNDVNTELEILHKDGKPAKKLNTDDINYSRKTIDDLSSIIPSYGVLSDYDGEICFVRDIYRGGMFIYDSTKAATNDSGVNFNGWVRQFSGAIDVKWFGAKGDGITDDTASINLAYASGYKDVHIDGVFKVSGTIYIPMGTKTHTGGYSTELRYYGIDGTIDGIVVQENNAYDYCTIEELTIRTMDSNGRYAISTPKSASLFTDKRPQFFFNIRSLGEDLTKTIFTYGWENVLNIGDCRGGHIDLIAYGRYNATIDDVGQIDDIAIKLSSTNGNIGIKIKAIINNIRRGLLLSDGTEGFSLQDGTEMVGVWIGVDSDSVTTEPGGFIGTVHINCNHRGLLLKDRAEINIGSMSVYRSDSFFDHTGDWVAIEVQNSLVNINKLNVVHGSLNVNSTSSKIALLINTSGSVDNCTASFGSNIEATGMYIDNCDDLIIGSSIYLSTKTLFSIVNGSTDISIGEVTIRGNHSETLKKYDIDSSIDRKRIYINKNIVHGIIGLYTTKTVDTSDTVVLKSGVDSPQQLLIADAGAAAYTYNIDLEEDEAVVGDIFDIKLILPSSTNPTINIRRQDSSFVLSSFNVSESVRFVAKYMFTGTAWEEIYVITSEETIH